MFSEFHEINWKIFEQNPVVEVPLLSDSKPEQCRLSHTFSFRHLQVHHVPWRHWYRGSGQTRRRLNVLKGFSQCCLDQLVSQLQGLKNLNLQLWIRATPRRLQRFELMLAMSKGTGMTFAAFSLGHELVAQLCANQIRCFSQLGAGMRKAAIDTLEAAARVPEPGNEIVGNLQHNNVTPPPKLNSIQKQQSYYQKNNLYLLFFRPRDLHIRVNLKVFRVCSVVIVAQH